MKCNRQQGVAIITAILIVALAASTASFIAWQQHLWIRQAENLQDQAQARTVARAGVDWARALLGDDLRQNAVDHLGEDWAVGVAGMPVEEGRISGNIADQQGLFNLNNLVRDGRASELDVEEFRRLLKLLELPPELADAVTDWIDADNDTRHPGGAEDIDYLRLEPAYRAANRPLTEVGGLIRVKGFDDAMVKRLRPYVTALPRYTDLNVNTAPAEVLAAAIADLPLNEARDLVEARKGAHFKDKADFRARLPGHVKQLRLDDLNVRSQYFLATSRAAFGRVRVGFQVLLERDGAAWPRLVWVTDL